MIQLNKLRGVKRRQVWLLAVFFLVLLTLTSIWRAAPILAERMASDSYVIQFGNFNITAGKKTSTTYRLTDTVGQTFAGPFGAYGSSTYFVGAGFQYIYQIQTFAFSISDVFIDLGTLTAGAHNTDSNVLRITTRGAGGYTVYAYELHPLRLLGGSATIADTTCNTGLCSESDADPWTTQTIAGFGFNAAGSTVPSDFVDSTYFRQFANLDGAETMKAVMTSPNIGSNDSATITYKAGISGTTAAGEYQTAVVYVAVPGY